jgi:hypothetical protein
MPIGEHEIFHAGMKTAAMLTFNCESSSNHDIALSGLHAWLWSAHTYMRWTRRVHQEDVAGIWERQDLPDNQLNEYIPIYETLTIYTQVEFFSDKDFPIVQKKRVQCLPRETEIAHHHLIF